MTLIGEIVPSEETRTVAEMVAENRPMVAGLAALIAAGVPRPEVAASARRSVVRHLAESLGGCNRSVDVFFRAAVMTALRKTVDWDAVLEIVFTNPEAN